MKLLRWLGGLALVLAAVLAVAWIRSAAAPPVAGSESARRLAPGPHPVGRSEHRFVDRSRPTDPNGDFPGAPERTLEATAWYPVGSPEPHPLLVYSHGFMSLRGENASLAALLASHDYVVISLDYPLTSRSAPGGPSLRDVVNQPGDLRFVIDQVLGWSERQRPFAGELDPARIGALGLSLGGLTTTLVTFHPKLRDPRIAAAVSIAGPAAMFSPAFFATADVPFLMIAGTQDAMVDHALNAATLPAKLRSGGLVSIAGGSHAGFAAIADGFPLRLLGNPDRIGCAALARNLRVGAVENPFTALGGEAEGVVFAPGGALPCTNGAPGSALAAGRQLMIMRLAALAFFESRFEEGAAERAAHDAYLREHLPRDFPEAGFRAAGSL